MRLSTACARCGSISWRITDNTLAPDIFLYAVEEATRRGFRTSAHVPMALTIEQVAAGQG